MSGEELVSPQGVSDAGVKKTGEPFPVRVRVGGAELDALAAGFAARTAQIESPEALAELFGRAAPLEADLGCGDGRFLVLTAMRHPERNFLGVERKPDRVRKACRKAVLAGCRNVRVVQAGIEEVVSGVLPKNYAERLHALFPDPWPKRRHSKNRLLKAEFFRRAAAALRPGGDLRVKTDSEWYFQEALRAAAECEMLDPAEWEESEAPVLTTFEARFLELGQRVWAARWVRRQ